MQYANNKLEVNIFLARGVFIFFAKSEQSSISADAEQKDSHATAGIKPVEVFFLGPLTCTGFATN